MIWFLFVVLVHNFDTTIGAIGGAIGGPNVITKGGCSSVYRSCRSGGYYPGDPGYPGSGSGTGSSSSAPPASKALLPYYEVKAIKYLLRSSKKPWDAADFSASDCDVRNEVNCTCDDATKICHINAIFCDDHELSGTIPEELGNLSSLQTLSLSGNKLNGPIPKSFSKLLNLISIDLDDNLLDGPIPSFLGNLTALTSLSFKDNLFHGPIPDALSNLRSLQYLNLGQNSLSEKIPYQLGSMTNLELLHLYDNQLSGPLPPEIGNLSNLTSLALENNKLIGRLPSNFKQLQNLFYVNLRGNKFTGKVPEDIGNWKYVRTLWLLGNNFEGPLPRAISTLANLTYLGVSDLIDTSTKKRGFLFPDISRMNLRFLTLRNCSITDQIPGYIFQMQNLNYLDLSFNNLTAEIPDPSSGMKPHGPLPTPKFIFLRGNKLSGSLPEWIINKTYSYVDISENNFTLRELTSAHISKNLNLFECANATSNMTEKWQINPYMCQNKTKHSRLFINCGGEETPINGTNYEDSRLFSNEKPTSALISKNLNLFECANITSNVTEKWQLNPYTCQDKTKYSSLFINCGGEETPINGTNYEADLEPNGGATFFLSKNGRWGYSSMGTFIQANLDLFLANRTCNMSMADSPLYTSARLAPISLKYFGFCLVNGNYSVKLDFAEILLDPDQGLRSKSRRVFDIEIQGKKVETDFNIAEAAGGVNQKITKEYKTYVNNSRLEIHLFWTGMGNIYEPKTAYYGPLISAIAASRVEKKHNSLSPLAISGIVGASLLLPLLVLLILWRRGYFDAKDPELEEIKEELQGKFFNFQKIKVATDNFSSDNKLGEGGFGSVFKGILSDGTAIAVKQFSAISRQGIREFANEIFTVSALQHPNLVKLLGCCAEDTQRLLVYEYMENNSLHHALFVSEELRKRLDWATRVKICHDIAKGLVFLHEESELKVVHRDIKPTNILLDKDFTAKISDFGFAKLYEGEASHIITRIAGTTGYMAPEYAMRGHLTYKADVYSFGVVLLEIVSGKNSASYLPDDQSVYLLDLACVLQKEGNLMDLVDPTLVDYDWDEANTILKLALVCTDRSYTLRPTMSEVVKILNGETKISNYSVGDHYSMDDSAMAKVIAGLSQSTHSGSTSHAGNSAVSLSADNGGTSRKETSAS